MGKKLMELVICMGALVRNMVCRELLWLGLDLGWQSRVFGAVREATGAEGRVLAVAFKNRQFWGTWISRLLECEAFHLTSVLILGS